MDKNKVSLRGTIHVIIVDEMIDPRGNVNDTCLVLYIQDPRESFQSRMVSAVCRFWSIDDANLGRSFIGVDDTSAGFGKSQLLRAASSVAPCGLYVCGG